MMTKRKKKNSKITLKITLSVFNLIYSISRLKEQVYYLLEKDPDYMAKTKKYKNSFFDDNVKKKLMKKLKEKSRSRVMPSLNFLNEKIAHKSNILSSYFKQFIIFHFIIKLT